MLLPFVFVAQQELSWQLLHPKTHQWITLGTKGSVQEALIATGELPDPYIGMNESKFAWVEDFDWEFRSEFSLSAHDKTNEIDLEFPNVDTYASIYLNGELIGKTDNAFVTFRYAIREKAKVGTNELKVVFQSPVSYQRTRLKQVGTVLPAPNDVGKVKVASLCRKPQYQFGWDWSLRMTTIGFWFPVKVVVYNQNRVTGKGIVTQQLSEDQATQLFSLEWRNTTQDTLVWESTLFGKKNVRVENNRMVRTESIEHPRMWWPRGQGKQELYRDHWVVKNTAGEVLYEEDVQFGVRKTELVQEKDQWGTSFVIKVNGRTIFCKGADYIPDDIFPARITDEKLVQSVKTMANCNFNMVRIWGGGFYPKESFLTACDEQGIMVWQDFMFACAMYPGDDAFVQNIQRELDQQIQRIAAHPSVVLFNGNNEVDVAWKNWGFQKTYHLSAKDGKLIESYYNRVFKQVIPEAIHRHTNVPYEHTSPLSNWGKDDYYNHGTQHYWGVWHGKDPMSDFAKKIGRFNAEYGFQSFPEFSTLATFSDSSEWRLNSEVMKHHQKSYVGNGMIAKHADLLFGKTSDFKRFVYYSQLTQARAVSMAVVGHRMDFPRCTGTIYWQYNDCWPAPTWSSIDYNNNWKALQYQVREDYRDVAVLTWYDSLGKSRYSLISDSPEGFSCRLHCSVYDDQGQLLETWKCQRAVLGAIAQELFVSELKKYENENVFLLFSWNDAFGNQFTKSDYRVCDEKKVVGAKSVSYEIVNIDADAQTAVLVVKNKEVLQDLWMTSTKLGVHFDSNFVDLIPGEHRFEFTFRELPQKSDLQLFWR